MYRKNATRTALFALGFLSIGTQIYLVREFMIVFSDNELIIGLVLACWMLITGAGSYLGRFSHSGDKKSGRLIFLLILTGMLPSLMVPGLDVLKVMMVPYGSLADPGQIATAAILVQLPFCMLGGFLFSYLSITSAGNAPGESYGWESLGSMISGALVNFILLWLMGPYQGLLLLTGLYLMLILEVTRREAGKKYFFAALTVTLACMTFFSVFDFRHLTEKLLYPAQHVVLNTETPFGQVVVTDHAGQLNYYENGELLFSSGNEISNEENVHYAMVQHPNPAKVLLISGGFAGTLAEIIKYRPVLVDYVELNPSLIGIASRFTAQLDHPSVRVHETDARKFVRNTASTYDVVLVNLPGPSTLQLNRYYSAEFLTEIRKKMSPGAVIAYNLPSGGEYVSEKAGYQNEILWRTLKQSFSEVLIIPAGRNYFLASDAALSLDIPDLVDARGIRTVYVNRYYLDAVRMKEKSEAITPQGPASLKGPVNHDFNPVAVWHHLSWWLSHFNISFAMILVVFLTVLLVLSLTLNPLNAGLFAGGFTLASVEIIIIVGLQVLSGYLFREIGAVIMVFMMGLAAGAGIKIATGKLTPFSLYRGLQISLAFLALFIPLIIRWMSDALLPGWLVLLVFAIMAFIASFIVGLEYRLASMLQDEPLHKTVPGNYSADMFGSAAGAFAVTLFLLPAFGMVNTGVVLAFLNLAAAASLFLWRRRL